MHPVVPVLHSRNEHTQEGMGTAMDFVYVLALTRRVKNCFPCVIHLRDVCAEVGGRAWTGMEASPWGGRRVPLR